jgi:hypothetical protein
MSDDAVSIRDKALFGIHRRSGNASRGDRKKDGNTGTQSKNIL